MYIEENGTKVVLSKTLKTNKFFRNRRMRLFWGYYIINSEFKGVSNT
jgi:hypothetical protein